jgi:NTE family protein
MNDGQVVAVLSGGGARCAAHVGAVKALSEYGLTPGRYVGTSMGAVIGACFASGLDYDDVVKRLTTITRRDVASFSPGAILGMLARSLLQERPLRETIAALVPARSFGELRTPLTVTAVDLDSGDLVLFGAGGRSHVPLMDALYASCALPVYYRPAVIGDRKYVDGGLRAVLPLDTALQFSPRFVAGVYVGPSRFHHAAPAGIGSQGIVAAHRQSVRIMMAVQAEETIARWRVDSPVDHVVVLPQVVRVGTFAVERVVEYIEDGYRATVRALTEGHGTS